MSVLLESKISRIIEEQEELLARTNHRLNTQNGIFCRYAYPVVTKEHIPLTWRYDLNPETNPGFLERIIFNSTMNAGAIYHNGKYLLMVRVETADRKSFFAVAESDNGVDNFRFLSRPVNLPELDPGETNVYDMRLTRHEDGWIYGVFCSERLDPEAKEGDLSSAIASSGLVRTRDLIHWERLPDLEARSQQRNVVLHPEFVDGKYAFYTRPQGDFIEVKNGGGIGWALVENIHNPVIQNEIIINKRDYHTIKEVKNGEGPAPIKTEKGWLHLAHGVRGTAAGLRYVLYLYVTSLENPAVQIAEPAGYLIAPEGEERTGDVSNVVFSNGWIAREDGTVFIYYASCDTRMHVAETSIDQLLDYCFNTPADGLRSHETVKRIEALIDKNEQYLMERR